MKQENKSALRKALLPLTVTAVAAGAFLGVPVMKALAQDLKTSPGVVKQPPAQMIVKQPPAQMIIIQPKFVHSTATRLVKIADEALADSALAERIFREPDAVAAQYKLSDNERLVLRHMTREQFNTARGDAGRLTADRLSQAASMRLPLPAGSTDARLITQHMVVGRAILAAVGRSYLEAKNKDGCCPWKPAIELGVNSSRGYAESFL